MMSAPHAGSGDGTPVAAPAPARGRSPDVRPRPGRGGAEPHTTEARGLLGHGEPPHFFRFQGLTAAGLPHATTTRHCPGIASPATPGGPFEAAAAATLAHAKLDLARVAYARQVHGADLAAAPSSGGVAGTVDGLVTTERGVPLAIFTADCLAITLWDAEAGVLALVHVGWRGTVKGAAQAAVRAATERGARPARLTGAISPSIGPCCYEVDDPVIAPLASAYRSLAQSWFTPARPGRLMLDLWRANEMLLADAGVDPARIENPRLCTACHPDLLYSHRRRLSGRLVTVAALA